MSTLLSPSELGSERVRPIRRIEYDAMVDAGLFRGERLELLRGLLVEMSPQNPPHAGAVERLGMLLIPAIAPRAAVRIQLPLALSDDSEPEPDVAVVAVQDSHLGHPASAILIIEVADASLAKDRKLKGVLYASASIPEYWIVNLLDRSILVHRRPTAAGYQETTRFAVGESVSPEAFPDIVIEVGDIVR